MGEYEDRNQFKNDLSILVIRFLIDSFNSVFYYRNVYPSFAFEDCDENGIIIKRTTACGLHETLNDQMQDIHNVLMKDENVQVALSIESRVTGNTVERHNFEIELTVPAVDRKLHTSTSGGRETLVIPIEQILQEFGNCHKEFAKIFGTWEKFEGNEITWCTMVGSHSTKSNTNFLSPSRWEKNDDDNFDASKSRSGRLQAVEITSFNCGPIRIRIWSNQASKNMQ